MENSLDRLTISDKLENAGLKNEYARTLIKTVSDDWFKITKVAEKEFESNDNNSWKTYHNVMNASRKIENLLNLTIDMLEEADYSNSEAIKGIFELKKKD